VRVDFRCEACRGLQTDIEIDYPEATVTCSDCEHAVDVGVYLGPDLVDEIEAERAQVAFEDRTDAQIKKESADDPDR
jgi:hypothetical protein